MYYLIDILKNQIIIYLVRNELPIAVNKITT